MGFFSAATGLLGGGSQSSSSSQSGGFNALPASIQGAYTGLGTQLQNLLNGGNLTSMYTPLGVQAGEQNAINNINTGFTPTQATINSDIAMQMNPYDSYVIDEINRQGQGANSVLQSNLSNAGQFGSNRGILGANDIDLTRLNQIGQFKQGQYNTALNNSLTTLTGQRQQDAANQLGAGEFLRGLDLQTKTAPVTALQQIATALGVLPTVEGGASQSSSSKSSNGFGGLLGQAGLPGLLRAL